MQNTSKRLEKSILFLTFRLAIDPDSAVHDNDNDYWVVFDLIPSLVATAAVIAMLIIENTFLSFSVWSWCNCRVDYLLPKIINLE